MLGFPGAVVGAVVGGAEGDAGGAAAQDTVLEFELSAFGAIIGRAGANVREVRAKTGAEVLVQKQDAARCVYVTVRGAPSQVQEAVSLVQELVRNASPGGQPDAAALGSSNEPRPPPTPPPALTEALELPIALYGAIIGTGGATVQGIKARTGAQVKLEKVPNSGKCLVNISGTTAQVAAAKEEVLTIAKGSAAGGGTVATAAAVAARSMVMAAAAAAAASAGGRGVPPPPLPARGRQGPAQEEEEEAGAEATESMEFEGSAMGNIIGPSGAHVKSARQQTGANISVKKIGEVCKVDISGTALQVRAARDLVNELAGGRVARSGAVGGGEASQQQGGAGGEAEDEVSFELEAKQARKVIGQAGSTVKRIRNDSGANVKVAETGEAGNSTVWISGSADSVDKARSMIHDLLTSPAKGADVEWTDEAFMRVSQAELKMLIGKSGANVSHIEQESWAKVATEKDADPGLVRITGSPEAVEMAWGMALESFEASSGGAGKQRGGGGSWAKKDAAWASGGGGAGGVKRKWSSEGWDAGDGKKWSKQGSWQSGQSEW